MADRLRDLHSRQLPAEWETEQDGVRFGSKLISKLGYLSNGLAASDHKPTDQHAEVRQILNTELV